MNSYKNCTHIRVIIFSIHKTPTLIIVSILKYKYSYNCMYSSFIRV